ncbi:Oocyst wall protein 6, related [Neospora caninum Liverpool]|uniref:Oocyst wall protein 6, related n=1 Tax=Neospora caninum (strain Liverpool) TaxID=572307 RepID=F0VJV3_NEOCL|nr:Oocyst wall protein 6, related [Neospora caninum Liverpool]CBZ54014.1 Oocyst wall protein 6, related [Neospora caninum Liverpool]|eukprot:XP_003884046.1 Oocyst wall protein 6, related [Neospora caninum Liverpool]
MSFQCPPDYDLVFNKCQKKVIRPPMPSCPYGSYMNEDGNCISVDKVPAERTCPAGYQPYEKGCLRRDLIQAVPFCPTHAFQLFQHGSESECIKLTETEPLLTCKEGVFDATLALCVSHGAEDPAVSCPPGFELNAEQVPLQCERRLLVDPVPVCEEDWELSPDPATGILECISKRKPPPVLVCPDGDSRLVDEACVRETLSDPTPACPAGFVYSRWDDMCRRVQANAATPICREGWKFIKETGKCTLEEEPTYLCPGDTDEDLQTLQPESKDGGAQSWWPEKNGERAEQEEDSDPWKAAGAFTRGRVWDTGFRAMQQAAFSERRAPGMGNFETEGKARTVQGQAKECATVEVRPPELGCENGELVSLFALEEHRGTAAAHASPSRLPDNIHGFPSALSAEDLDTPSPVFEETRSSPSSDSGKGPARKQHFASPDTLAAEDLFSDAFPGSSPSTASSFDEGEQNSAFPSRLKMLNLRRPLGGLGRGSGSSGTEDERKEREQRDKRAKRDEVGEALASPDSAPPSAVEGETLEQRGEAKVSPETGRKRALSSPIGAPGPRRGGQVGDSDAGREARRLEASDEGAGQNSEPHESQTKRQERKWPPTLLDSPFQLSSSDRWKRSQPLKGSGSFVSHSRDGRSPSGTSTSSSSVSKTAEAHTPQAPLPLHRSPPPSRQLSSLFESPQKAAWVSPQGEALRERAGHAPFSSAFTKATESGLVCREHIVVAPTVLPGECSQNGSAPRGRGKEGLGAREECVEVRTKKPILRCPSGQVVDDLFFTPRCEQVDVEPVTLVCADGSPPSSPPHSAGPSSAAFGDARCMRKEFAPSVALCSEGSELQAATGKCVLTLKETPGWTCPTGYRLPERELPPQSAREIVAPHLGSRKGDSASPLVVGAPLPAVQAGFCERLEYANVQFICPVGFGREKDKKTKEWVCVADKAVPSTRLCASGFFLEGDVCVMHLTMAPSLVDQDGRPFPCVTRGDGTNSCGHAADWQGALGVPENEASGLKKTGKL